MPSYAQLQAESWWGREIVTPELDWLGDTLCARTGRPRAAFGTKGDDAHVQGAHRSQEWILRSRYATSRTYTVQSGLTQTQQRHVAGVDFTPGSAAQMIAQCKRIYAAMRAGKLDEVREFYGNVNGDKIVDGWDNVRDRAASSDSSHLWHWHLSIDRRHCADRRLMERILGIVLGEDDDMALSASDLREVTRAANAATEGVRLLVVLRDLLGKLGPLIAEQAINPAEARALFAELPTAEETAEATVSRLVGGGVSGLADVLRRGLTQAEVAELVATLSEGGAATVPGPQG